MDNPERGAALSSRHKMKERKRKYWLARDHDNVSEWGYRTIRGLLFQWASTIEFKLRVFVLYKADLIIIIPSTINLFMPWYSYKIAELALNNNYSLSVTQMLHVYWYLSSISDQVILFLTDGGFDAGRDPREVIRDENAKLQNRVIVFTYLLGPGMFVYFIYRAVVYRRSLSQSVELHKPFLQWIIEWTLHVMLSDTICYKNIHWDQLW